MSVSPLVSAIVVSYNTRDMTLECLRALKADLAGMPSETWVVDNASSDGSAEAVEKHFPEVHVLQSGRNAGFGAANNMAMERARGDLFLLVNSDAFLRPGCARGLADCLERHPDAAVAGPRIVRPDGSLQISCFRFPSPGRSVLENLFVASLFPNHPALGDYRRWAHDIEREVDWVIGACMLVRRKAYEQVGGFDERFFMYAEETDWQKRMRAAGWKVWFTPAGETVHVGGGSGQKSKTAITAFHRSKEDFFFKHYGLAGVLTNRLTSIAGALCRVPVYACLSLLKRDDRLASIRRREWQEVLWWNLTASRRAGRCP
ncbi:MAG: glycosyl transferase [Armatimonadota bacterium]|nr:MAG: glycosyl transferase [Armatimonadota bacterium]